MRDLWKSSDSFKLVVVCVVWCVLVLVYGLAW